MCLLNDWSYVEIVCVIECIYVLLVVYLIKLNIFILSKFIIFFYLIGGVGGNGGGVICL